tara:strand:+ start:6375 stop:6707 length:333 start_codon:yes stop_codon:yes gene_type:complete
MSDGIWFQQNSSISTIKFAEKNLTTIQEAKYILDSIYKMLDEKNKAYGDSALNPIRLFSRADAQEAIRVRIDDKLSRIKNQDIHDNEDSISDLIGYLVLLKVAIKKKGDN